MEIQKLRCHVNFAALRFSPEIEELGRRVVQILRRSGPFVVLQIDWSARREVANSTLWSGGCA
uniref:Uncharacterized protein n=1 Tax=Oryza brachyantha TaxID=4533 RepID=J3LV32_ORYBR